MNNWLLASRCVLLIFYRVHSSPIGHYRFLWPFPALWSLLVSEVYKLQFYNFKGQSHISFGHVETISNNLRRFGHEKSCYQHGQSPCAHLSVKKYLQHRDEWSVSWTAVKQYKKLHIRIRSSLLVCPWRDNRCKSISYLSSSYVNTESLSQRATQRFTAKHRSRDLFAMKSLKLNLLQFIAQSKIFQSLIRARDGLKHFTSLLLARMVCLSNSFFCWPSIAAISMSAYRMWIHFCKLLPRL